MGQKKEESSRQFWKEPSRASGSSFSARNLFSLEPPCDFSRRQSVVVEAELNMRSIGPQANRPRNSSKDGAVSALVSIKHVALAEDTTRTGRITSIRRTVASSAWIAAPLSTGIRAIRAAASGTPITRTSSTAAAASPPPSSWAPCARSGSLG